MLSANAVLPESVAREVEDCLLPPEVNEFLKHKLSDFGFAFTISDPYKPDNPICYASSKFYEMTGYQPAEVMEIRDAIREQRACQVLLLNYRKDGQPFWNQFYMAPMWKADGKLQHYVGIQTDVTSMVDEGKHPEFKVVLVDGVPEVVAQEHQGASHISQVMQACSLSNNYSELPCCLLQPLLKVQQSFVLADPSLPDMPIVHASDTFLALTGYPRSEVVGRNCRFLQGPGTDRAEVARLKAALTADPPLPVTVTLLNYRKDGKPFWNALHVAPVRDADGNVAFFLGVQLDVTMADDSCEEHIRAAPLGLTQKMAHKGTLGAVRQAVRSLVGEAGLRRSLDCGQLLSPPQVSTALCQHQPWSMPAEEQGEAVPS